jgi:hypothetical protein
MVEHCIGVTRKGTDCSRRAVLDGVCIQHSRSSIKCVECGSSVLQKDATIVMMATGITRCVAYYNCAPCLDRQVALPSGH